MFPPPPPRPQAAPSTTRWASPSPTGSPRGACLSATRPASSDETTRFRRFAARATRSHSTVVRVNKPRIRHFSAVSERPRLVGPPSRRRPDPSSPSRDSQIRGDPRHVPRRAREAAHRARGVQGASSVRARARRNTLRITTSASPSRKREGRKHEKQLTNVFFCVFFARANARQAAAPESRAPGGEARLRLALEGVHPLHRGDVWCEALDADGKRDACSVSYEAYLDRGARDEATATARDDARRDAESAFACHPRFARTTARRAFPYRPPRSPSGSFSSDGGDLNNELSDDRSESGSMASSRARRRGRVHRVDDLYNEAHGLLLAGRAGARLCRARRALAARAQRGGVHGRRRSAACDGG